ncbi:hypothetical protein LCGC14_0829240 [marine sediment metagenome]|uniref:Uncharacterized protein n=1 Tax=marine sediment metagenome TaxID=412755 RepID=A0A0F9SNY8_9ZZZZ
MPLYSSDTAIRLASGAGEDQASSRTPGPRFWANFHDVTSSRSGSPARTILSVSTCHLLFASFTPPPTALDFVDRDALRLAAFGCALCLVCASSASSFSSCHGYLTSTYRQCRQLSRRPQFGRRLRPSPWQLSPTFRSWLLTER